MNTVKEQQMLPSFHLESTDGKIMGPQDYKDKSNIVLFFFDLECAPCSDFLSEAMARYEEYKEENTEILAVGEGSVEDVREVQKLLNLPFPVLADPNGDTLGKYSDSTPAVFAADRFGEIKMTAPEMGSHDIDHDSILSTIELTNLECPECGVSTWPRA